MIRRRSPLAATFVMGSFLATTSGCTPAGPADESGAGGEAEWSTMSSYQAARAIVQAAFDALGGTEALERAGGLALEGEGVLDLGTLLQGMRPFEGGDIHAIQERIAILPGADRWVHELRTPLNPDALTWHRTDYRPAGTYRIDLMTSQVRWTRPASRTRVERTIPHHLLAEVLRDPASLRHHGRVQVAGEPREAVTWQPPGRPLMTLLFDTGTSLLLREAEAIADLSVRGDTRVRWAFLPYRDIEGLGPFPDGYTIHVDDERLQEIRWRTVTVAPAGGVLDPPEGVELPEAMPVPPASSESGQGGGSDDSDEEPEETFDISELAPGVHLLVNLRVGFHMLFVELEDHVVAVDAPAGWWELQELPPRDWAGMASPALGERYVRGIRSVVGDKPIRHVILTHHHSDHMGGVRAFVEEGATVHATETTRPVVERTLAASLTLAGREAGETPPLRFESVQGETVLGDGERAVHVLDVGENPHAEGMLAVWLPNERILYVSDLFEPWSSGSRPSPDRIPVMRWFVDWLDGSGLEPERIYAIHRAALVSDENLEEIRRGMSQGG